VVSTFAVFLVVIASLIGASTAAAQGGHGVSIKKVESVVKRYAMWAGGNQHPVFPNAEVSGTDAGAWCVKGNKRGTWECLFSIYVYEQSLSNPAQHTLRLCENPTGSFDDPLRVKRYGPKWIPRRVYVPDGAWQMSCELDQFAIDLWNRDGPAYLDQAASSRVRHTRTCSGPAYRWELLSTLG
jgi:hypothetical protein